MENENEAVDAGEGASESLGTGGNDGNDRQVSGVDGNAAASASVETVAETTSDDAETAVDAAVASDNSTEDTEEVSADETPPKPRHPDLKWYVVNAYSGFEMKAKKSLEERIRVQGLDDLFGEIRVPEETVVELVKGERKTSNRKFFPGYILVEMVMTQDTWHLVKETPKVSGFVGDATDPSPLLPHEVARIVEQEEEGAQSPRARVNFAEGDNVKVVDGPFADYTGSIEEVKPEKGKVKVLISIFGRATPVEFDFIQVEKA